MIRGNEIEEEIYDPIHQEQVLAAIKSNFPQYFASFSYELIDKRFDKYINEYAKEQDVYREYLNRHSLEEFEYAPNAFKTHTKKNCPIIKRCLWSQDEIMKAYKRSFNQVTGRQLLDAVSLISKFTEAYVANFDDEVHEAAQIPDDLELNTLNEGEYGCAGVIGYGIQSSLIYGVYPQQFAHRSQNAVWSLYFLSGRQDFGLEDSSEFLMVHPDYGTVEQNYFYPAGLFGFYALKTYLLLKRFCAEVGVKLLDHNRYIYLSAFCDHVADTHREDINIFRRSSDDVEAHWF